MSVNTNVIANFLGQGAKGLATVALIPLYIKYLGIEAYGVIGIFAVLQAWLTVFDMGLTPALGREMARFTAGAHDAQSIRNLLRSIEVIAFTVALVIALIAWLGADWLASDWLNANSLPVATIADSIGLMGLVAGFRLIEDVYSSCLVGLQLQVQNNLIIGVAAIARALGAVAVLAWVSPTIEAFFIWQVIVSATTLLLLGAAVYRALPIAPVRAQFSLSALVGIREFAAGMVAITFLGLLLTQFDKILLSRLLSLEAFAYYALASVVAAALYLFVGPFTSAFYPRFTELVTQQKNSALPAVYHEGAQMVTVTMGSAAMVLMIFGERLLALWTGDPALTREVAPILTALALGTLLNGLNWMPYQMQLAHGWTSLGIIANTIAVVVLVPATYLIAPSYGAIGTACLWIALNAFYLIFSIYFMHRKILRAEKWRWYVQDVALPLGAAATIVGLLRAAMPSSGNKLAEIGTLALALTCALIAAGLTAPAVRRLLPIEAKKLP